MLRRQVFPARQPPSLGKRGGHERWLGDEAITSWSREVWTGRSDGGEGEEGVGGCEAGGDGGGEMGRGGYGVSSG